MANRERRLRAVIALMMPGVAVAGAPPGDISVRAVVPPVFVIHDGTHTKLPLSAGALVQDADELLGGSDQASVQLECPNGATQTLSARFDAVVNARSAGSRCAIDLKSGAVVATALATAAGRNTDGDASVRGGPFALTSHHTQFGLMMAADARNSAQAFVIDGEARLGIANAASVKSLRQGQAIDALSATVGRIPEQTFQTIASTYAQLDLAQLGRAATAELAAKLQSSWVASLRQPDDVRARRTLADLHASLGLGGSAMSRYQRLHSEPMAGVTFEKPMHGAYRLDSCLPNNRCGKDTAVAWCRAQGYAAARTWVPDYDIGDKAPTQRMGSVEVCNRGPCDGFKSITCE
jgi:hypothetical protein